MKDKQESQMFFSIEKAAKWAEEYKKTHTREEHMSYIKKRAKTNGWKCLGEIEYENMPPVNEGIFGPEDFLWYHENKALDLNFYAVGGDTFSGNNYAFKSELKITPRQFLTMLISEDQDLGTLRTGYHAIRKIVERNPRIRLKGWKRWLKPNLDYYYSKIGIREIK